MKAVIIGQGYVGLTLAVAAAKSGHQVIGFDVNTELVSSLASGKSHVEGVGSSDLKALLEPGKYSVTSDVSVLDQADVVLIAVPTPLDEKREPDLSYVDAAVKLIDANVKHKVLVINESTSFPGTLRKHIAGAIAADHLYAASPERVDPGNSKWTQKNTPRIIAGLTPEATAKAKEFYGTFCDELVEVSSPEVAEAAKLFENTFRQVNIALVNEFAQIAGALDIPTREVLDAAETKPFGFMPFSPGPGVGGHCIPVDPIYLAYAAENAGAPATFIRRANDVNLGMPACVVSRVKAENGGSLKGKKVLLVGLSYKANVADTREAPSLLVIEALKAESAVVSWHDPLVGRSNGEESSPLSGADIAIVVTMHDVIDVDAVKASAGYVFDCTGKVPGVSGL